MFSFRFCQAAGGGVITTFTKSEGSRVGSLDGSKGTGGNVVMTPHGENFQTRLPHGECMYIMCICMCIYINIVIYMCISIYRYNFRSSCTISHHIISYHIE